MAIDIFVPIDVQNGFSRLDLDGEKGGSLYVPGGEEIDGDVAGLAQSTAAAGGFMIISQDYHPNNHVSFMTNHPGILEYRADKFAKFLKDNGQEVPQDRDILKQQCIQPIYFFPDLPPAPFPFHEVLLDKDGRALGLVVEDGILDVETDEKGRVTKVSEDSKRKFDRNNLADGQLIQMLWKPHCTQRSESAELTAKFGEAVTSVNPLGLDEGVTKIDNLATAKEVKIDQESKTYLVTKGKDPQVDSYGVAIENDQKTTTKFVDVLEGIGSKAKKAGETEVNFNIGGIATNFCVEFSLQNIAQLAPNILSKYGITDVNIRFLPEISRGIPIEVPEKQWPDLATSSDRMRGYVEQANEGSVNMNYSEITVQNLQKELNEKVLTASPNDTPRRSTAKGFVNELRNLVNEGKVNISIEK